MLYILRIRLLHKIEEKIWVVGKFVSYAACYLHQNMMLFLQDEAIGNVKLMFVLLYMFIYVGWQVRPGALNH